MLENIRLSFRGIWSHKMRSFLTMLGIIIGIAAIIAIVSTIQGTNEQIEKNLIGSGSNNVKVTLQKDGYDMDLSYDTAPAGVTEVSAATLDSIKELDHVQNAALYLKNLPSAQGGRPVHAGRVRRCRYPHGQAPRDRGAPDPGGKAGTEEGRRRKAALQPADQ